MKKILSLVLALTMALLAIPSLAETAEALPLEGALVVLHTNDVHGRAMATDDSFGYARVAAFKKNLQALGASVLLVDAGDYSQGAPIVNLSTGAAAMEFMNAAGYDAATLGNHEFDWGTDNLLQNVEKAEFAVLCANITRTADGTTLLPANKIFDMPNGMKVGVFGLDTPETMTKAHPDKVKGITFAKEEELYAVAQAQVDELRAAGCDVVICLGHLGDSDESQPNRSVDLLEKVTGIDLLVDGHSHSTIDGGEMTGDTLRVSTGEYSEAIGYVVIAREGEGEEAKLAMTAGLYTMECASLDEVLEKLKNGQL